MAMFSKKENAQPKAAVGAARYANGNGSNLGAGMVDKFVFYTASPSVEAALSIPTVSRARDLIASMIGCLTFKAIFDAMERRIHGTYLFAARYMV
jgi:hypothetical protein